MQVSSQLGGIDKAILNDARRKRAAENYVAVPSVIDSAAIMPHEAGALVDGRVRIKVVIARRDVTGARCINAPQMADTGSLRWFLPNPDVNALIGNHWCGHNIIPLISLGHDGVTVEFPDWLAA